MCTHSFQTEYVKSVSQFKLETAVEQELEAFLSGFWEVRIRLDCVAVHCQHTCSEEANGALNSCHDPMTPWCNITGTERSDASIYSSCWFYIL